MRKLGWWTLLAVAAASCADPQAPRTDAPAFGAKRGDESARRKLLAADQAHSAASGSAGAAGFLASLDENALFLLPLSSLAEGKAAAGALLDAPPFPFARGMKLHWTPVFADASPDGQVGYTFGNLRITGGAVPGLLGQYIAFWRRTRGEWKVEAWSFSGAGAEPGPAPDFDHFPLFLDHPPGSADEARQALLATDAAFSQASVDLGQAPAFRDYADLNAVVLAGGDPDFIIGRQAIYESPPGHLAAQLDAAIRRGRSVRRSRVHRRSVRPRDRNRHPLRQIPHHLEEAGGGRLEVRAGRRQQHAGAGALRAGRSERRRSVVP